jgi:UDP-glucose 4,6-dehydratase
MKVLIIGSTGWIGKNVMLNAMKAGLDCSTISRSEFWIDESFQKFVDSSDVVINCAGYAGLPNVDACELEENKHAVQIGNVEVPRRIAKFCRDTPFLHVSSGCLFQGRRKTGKIREAIDFIDKDYSIEEWQEDSWNEEDEPNYTGSYYARTKIEGEKVLKDSDCWILRPRMFYSLLKSDKNFITKISRYNTIVNAINSVTYLGEFCISIIKCITNPAPFGIYNITHPIPILTSRVLEAIGEKDKSYVQCEAFNKGMVEKGLAQRSFTTLDSRKSIKHGIALSDDPMKLIRQYMS